MKPKQAIAAFTTLLFMFAAVLPVMADITISHPALKVFGQVTKPVYVGRSIFEYKDDQGLSSVLPFSRQDESITINFADIVFSDAFENKSVSLATKTISAQLTDTVDYLVQNDIGYIYIKITNNSALSTETWYNAKYMLSIVDEPTVTNDYYLIATMKIWKTGTNIAGDEVWVKFYFVDSGATTRVLSLRIRGDTLVDDAVTSGIEGTTEYVDFRVTGKENVWHTLQVQIQWLLDKAGKSWELVKLTKVEYYLGLKTGTTLDASSTVETEIRHAFIASSKVYIDDGTETGLVVNGTSGAFPYSAGDILNVYGANATKIVDVTIPWQVEVTPEIQTDPDNLRMQYTWEWTMPKSPTGTGDTLTFSSTNITLYGYKDGSAWDKLYVNGVDKLSSIATKTVPTDADYWTYGLASSLVEGNMYQIVARITYTAEEYDALTEAPLFWSNPFAWLQYKFWSLIIAVAAFLGLGTAWATKQRRRVQVPKR